MGGPPWVAELPEPEREHRFHPVRRWPIDFAWPAYKVGVEIQGGIFQRDGHADPVLYVNDCRKMNEAVALGWKMLWFTSKDLYEEHRAVIRLIANLVHQGRAEGCLEQLALFK